MLFLLGYRIYGILTVGGIDGYCLMTTGPLVVQERKTIMKKESRAAGKMVVITGASSGVGKAMAIALAEEGAKLVLAARRKEALEEVVQECKKLGAAAIAVPADTRDAEALHRLAQRAEELGGSIDVWINNAGVLAAGELETIPAEINEEVIRTNLIGYIHGAHAVLPLFKKQGYGLLINNISVGGWFPTPYMTAYCASKFGLQGFSESLKGELKSYPRIHVCDLYPAFLDTPGVQHAANYTGRELTPSPPVYDPREVARTVLSLLRSPRSVSGVGVFPYFLRAAYRWMPALARTMTAALIRAYLKGASPASPTSGNVLQPVAFGSGIDGGWRTTSLLRVPRQSVWLLAGVAAGLFLLGRKG